jgi:ABC-type transporter Mla subunit MlaD
MTKEIDIEKVIKRVQNEADKKNERRFDGMMEVMNDNFKKVEDLFKGVFEKLDAHSKILDSHTEQIGNVLVDLNAVKIDIGQVRYDIALTLDRKLDKKHFVDLDRRVRILEKK